MSHIISDAYICLLLFIVSLSFLFDCLWRRIYRRSYIALCPQYIFVFLFFVCASAVFLLLFFALCYLPNLILKKESCVDSMSLVTNNLLLSKNRRSLPSRQAKISSDNPKQEQVRQRRLRFLSWTLSTRICVRYRL